jgi:hypothetical protein
VCTSYNLSNAESTFRDYGFLPDHHNMALGMPLARALPAEDPLLELKAEIFRDAKLRTYDLQADYVTVGMFRMFALLRFVVFNDGEDSLIRNIEK